MADSSGSLAGGRAATALVLIHGSGSHGRLISILLHPARLRAGVLGAGSHVLSGLPLLGAVALLLVAGLAGLERIALMQVILLSRLHRVTLVHALSGLQGILLLELLILLPFEGSPGRLGLALRGDVLGDIGRLLEMLLQRRQRLPRQFLKRLVVSRRCDVLGGQDVLHMLPSLVEHVG